MSIFEDQAKFMRLGGQTLGKLNLDQARLYVNLINEETKEFFGAVEDNIDTEVIKEAVDILVVTSGFLLSLGIDPQKAWDLVYQTNLSKVTGTIEKREDGKIMKSEEYKKTLKAQLSKDLWSLIHVES